MYIQYFRFKAEYCLKSTSFPNQLETRTGSVNTIVMFADPQCCPCIFDPKWASHEESCGAAKHQCLTCKYCLADIGYWESVDRSLGQPEKTGVVASQGYDNRITMPKLPHTEMEKEGTANIRPNKPEAKGKATGQSTGRGGRSSKIT